MKMHPLLLAMTIVLFAVAGLYSQTCYIDGVTFTSQTQIDSFPAQHPGCSEIVVEGDVTVLEDLDGDIVSLDSLYPIAQIEGNLSIGESYPSYSGNVSLFNLSGLDNIVAIGGNLGVRYNNALSSFSGLEKVTSIGSLVVENNDSLISLSGLGNLTSIVGYMRVSSNPALTSFSGIENVTSIGGDLRVEQNDLLTSLSGLDSLTSIGGSLLIYANTSLTSLNGLEKVTSISGDLAVFASNLTSFNGIENVTSIGGDLRVEQNDSLTSLSGLGSLDSIGGRLLIYINTSLTSLSGLDSLTSVLGNVDIGGRPKPLLNIPDRGNPSLLNLSGLGSLTSIGGSLSVESNDSLTNLSGLDNLTSIGGNLSVSYNDALTICEIKPICDYLANGGGAEIHDNAPGCNSQQEVEDACATVSVDDLLLDEAIQLFPNPTTGIIQITTPDNTEWNVSVRDAMGRMMIQPHELVNGEIDLSNVPTGLYLLELNDGQHSITKRIIKQ